MIPCQDRSRVRAVNGVVTSGCRQLMSTDGSYPILVHIADAHDDVHRARRSRAAFAPASGPHVAGPHRYVVLVVAGLFRQIRPLPFHQHQYVGIVLYPLPHPPALPQHASCPTVGSKLGLFLSSSARPHHHGEVGIVNTRVQRKLDLVALRARRIDAHHRLRVILRVGTPDYAPVLSARPFPWSSSSSCAHTAWVASSRHQSKHTRQ